MQTPLEPTPVDDPAPAVRRELAAIVLIGCAVAALAMLLAPALNPVGDYGVETDFFAEVVPEVAQWQQGEIPIGRFRGPLFGALVAAAEPVVGDAFRAAKLLSGLFGGLFVVAVGLLTTRRGSPGVGIGAALLAATAPVVLRHCTVASTDLLFASLTTAALAAIAGPFRARPSLRAFVAGLLGAAAALTRYNGLPVLIVLLAIAALAEHGATRRRRALLVVASAVGQACLVMPWGGYTRAETGRWFANDNHLNLAYAISGEQSGGWDAFWYSGQASALHGFGDVVRQDPSAFVGYLVAGIPSHVWSDVTRMAGWPLAVAAALALLVTARQAPDRREVALVGYGLAMFAVLLLVFPDPRFSLPLFPVWAALAVRPLWARRSAGSSAAKVVALSMVIACQLSVGIVAEARRSAGQPVDILEVRDRFDAEVPAELRGARIAARKPHVGYHLGLEFRMPPQFDRFRDLAVWLTEQDVDLLYISGVEAMMWPRLAPLQRAEQVPAVLTPLIVVQDPPAALYRVNHALIRDAARSPTAPSTN